ncbi:MAG TPA: STAS domain-containing protein [Planctomycetota bacterium]
MKLETHLADDHAVLRLVGDFETYAVRDFLDGVQSVRDQGHSLLVLNMRRVKFVNSTAIGAILRARKELSAAGGGVALARSSAFVRDVFSKLGLDPVLPQFEEEDEAAAALLEDAGKRQVAATPGGDEAALFFRFYAQEKADLLGGTGVGAGEISLLDLDGITFAWESRKSRLSEADLKKLFSNGAEVEVKFRLPLYSKATYYVSRARVESLNVVGKGVRVRAIFTGLDDDAAQAVRQYVADMKLVRDELEQAQRGS